MFTMVESPSQSKSKKPKQKRKAQPGAAINRDAHFFEEVMAFLLLFALFFSLLWQGLLFEVQKTPAILVFSLLFSVLLLKMRFAGDSHSLWLKRPFAIRVFLLLTGASVLSLFNAVYIHNALLSLSRSCSLLLLALAVNLLREKIPFARWTLRAFTIAGVIVALLGIDGVWGGYIVDLINNALSGGAVPEGSQGFLFQMVYADRLSSLFQYPNTTAAFLLAAWFAAVHQYAREGENRKTAKGGARGRMVRLYLLPGLANLIFLAFILTVSRGMYLISVPVMLAYYLLLPRAGGRPSLLPPLVCFLPAFLPGFLALPGNALRTAGPLAGWAATVALLLAAAGLSLGLNRCASRRGMPESQKEKPEREKPESRLEGQKAKPENKADLGKVPRRAGAAALICAAAALVAVLIPLLAWQSSLPFALDGGQPLVRQFKVQEAGDYRLRLRFARPIMAAPQGMSLLLTGQNRKEMLQDQRGVLIQTDLTGYAGQSEIQLPFTAAEPETYVQLHIANPPFTADTPTGAVGAAEANQLLSVDLTVDLAEGEAKAGEVKLGRYLFSEALVQRIEAILNPKSMYDRFGFYLDAYHIFLDYPLTGIGGDSWSRIYHSYQNFFYTANDIHSYAVQLAVEYGVLGILGLAAIVTGFLSALAGCIRGRGGDGTGRGGESLVFLVMAGTLFLHSLMDVDFAFYSEYLLFALLFALLDIPLFGKERPPIPEADASGLRQPGQDKPQGQEKQRGQGKTFNYRAWLRDGFAVAVMLAACLLPFQFNRAISQTMTAAYLMEAGNLDDAIVLTQGAVKSDPFRPEYKALTAIRLAMAKAAPAGTGEAGPPMTAAEDLEMQELAAAAAKEGRYSADTFVMLLEYYYNTGQFEEAYAASGRLVELEPYQQDYWLGRGQLIAGILEAYDGSEGAAYVGEAGAATRRDWLERGAAIAQEMQEMFAAKWSELRPGDELLALITAWQEELAALP
jgi:tetratricopeptide (TPR) repeat protein